MINGGYPSIRISVSADFDTPDMAMHMAALKTAMVCKGLLPPPPPEYDFEALEEELSHMMDADFEEVEGEGSGNAIALTVNAPAAVVDDDRLAEEAFGANFDMIDWEEVQQIDQALVLDADSVIIPTHVLAPEVGPLTERANVLVEMFRYADATGDLPPEVDNTPVPAPIEYGGFGDETIDYSKLFGQAA